MEQIKTKIGEGGRIVIPAEYRKVLDLKPGDDVVLSMEDGSVRVSTIQQAIKHAQALVRRFVPEGRDLVEELMQERREEAARE